MRCTITDRAKFTPLSSLNEEQIDVFRKILDYVSDTAVETRVAYKVGFKDGATLMKEI